MLREATEPTATYEIRGDEGYVRARVLESNGRMAWCQPVMVSPRASARGGPAGLWLMVMLSVGICGWKYGNSKSQYRSCSNSASEPREARQRTGRRSTLDGGHESGRGGT